MLRALIAFFGFISAIIWIGYMIYAEHQFDMACTGYLVLAAESVDAQYALDQVDSTLQYLENNGLANTRVNTAIFFKSQTDNLHEWVKRIRDVREKLSNVVTGKSSDSEAEVMRTVRQTFISGTTQNVPSWIYLHPNQGKYLAWLWASLVMFLQIWFAKQKPVLPTGLPRPPRKTSGFMGRISGRRYRS